MAWSTQNIPDLNGKVAVVTGANGGLGLETARALAGAGAHVVMAARDQEKAGAAEKSILETHPSASLEVVGLDLGSLASVREAADRILAGHEKIDILVNNAGVMALPQRKTADGFEMQFGVNHLGHFALTAHLLPALLRADAARVVSVTSTAHHMGTAIDPKNPHLEGNYGEWKAYSQSKLANFHFAIGLQRRFEAAGVKATSLVAHPGLSDTDLQATSVSETDGGFVQRFFHGLASSTGMTPAAGALPQIRAACDPDTQGGEFYAPRFVNNGPPVRRPILRRLGLSSAIATLWEVSERETGVSLDAGGGACSRVVGALCGFGGVSMWLRLALIAALVLTLTPVCIWAYYDQFLNPRVARELRENPDGERARKVMLLTLPSGRAVPVNFYRDGDMVYAGADGRWWTELDEGPAAVEVLVRGETYLGTARAVLDDPEYTARIFEDLRPNAVEGFGTLVEIRIGQPAEGQR